MLCQKCSRRERCRKACSNLRKHLEKLENSQREPPLVPLLLDQSILVRKMTDPDSGRPLALEEVEISALLPSLAAREQMLLQSYFWEGESFTAIARKMRLSLYQTRRLFDEALAKLRRLILAKRISRKVFLPFAKKYDYNKNLRHEKGQRQK